MPTPPEIPAQPSRVSQKPALSLGLSIAGLFCLGPITSIPAIVLGHLALSDIRQAKVQARGRDLAIAGLWIGYTSLVLQAILVLILSFPDQIAYRIKCLTTSPNYAFTLAVQNPSCRADEVVPVLFRRLRNAGVPHKIAIASPTDIEVQVVADKKYPADAVKRLLINTAYLEFRLVHEDNAALTKKLFDDGKAPPGYSMVSLKHNGRDQDFLAPDETVTDENLIALPRFQAPTEHELMLERVTIAGRKVFRPIFVRRRAELDSTSITRARVDYRGLGEPVVSLRFDKKGAYQFHQLTTDYSPNGPRNANGNEGRRLAIIVDRVLYSAPIIREPISGGNAEISGNFTSEEAHFLANLLNAGSLPVPLAITDEHPIER